MTWRPGLVTVGAMSDPTALPNFAAHLPPQQPNGSPGGPDGGSQTPVRDRIMESLRTNGIESKIDADGDIEFGIVDSEDNTITLFARVAEGDVALVRFFGQWTLQAPVSADRNERLERLNDLTMQLNLVKLSLVQDNVVVSAEHVVTPATDVDLLVGLSVNHIVQSVGFFFQSWQAQDGAGDAAASSDGSGAGAGPAGESMADPGTDATDR